MRFVRVFLIIIALVLSMTCHAQTVSLSQLTNTKWKLTKPVFSYCDKTMSFTSTEMTNTSSSHYVKREYIVFERKDTYKGKEYEDFFCGEILSLESNRLTIRMKHSTILFIAK